jgi:hypothetical protein
MWAGALTLAATVSACSGADSAVAPSQPTSAAAALAPANVDKDVAAASGTAIVTDLDNFATSDVFGGLAVASVNVPVVRLSDNTPAPTHSDTAHHADSVHVDTVQVSHDDSHPAGWVPTIPASGTGCVLDSGNELHCAFGFGPAANNASTVTFVDAHGVVTKGFVPGVTDTVRTTLDAMRRIASADSSFVGVYYRKSTRAVGGFIDPNGNRTTNGAGTGADTTAFKGKHESRTYAGVSADTIRALVFAEHRRQNPYPKSGTMIRAVQAVATATDDKGATVTTAVNRRVVVTFDGTATATLQVGSTTCQLHLDTRKVDSCH